MLLVFLILVFPIPLVMVIAVLVVLAILAVIMLAGAGTLAAVVMSLFVDVVLLGAFLVVVIATVPVLAFLTFLGGRRRHDGFGRPGGRGPNQDGELFFFRLPLTGFDGFALGGLRGRDRQAGAVDPAGDMQDGGIPQVAPQAALREVQVGLRFDGRGSDGHEGDTQKGQQDDGSKSALRCAFHGSISLLVDPVR